MKRHRKSKAPKIKVGSVSTARGLNFQGIRLRCRKCGEIAFAAKVEVALMFGWSAVRHLRGPCYTGRCIDHEIRR